MLRVPDHPALEHKEALMLQVPDHPPLEHKGALMLRAGESGEQRWQAVQLRWLQVALHVFRPQESFGSTDFESDRSDLLV